MLSRKQRMSKTLAREVFMRGSGLSSPHFLLKTLKSPDTLAHCAVSVSKKVAPTAVVRNTLRRRAYTVIRNLWPRMTSGTLFAISIKNGAEKLDFEAFSKEIEVLLNRAHLV